MRVNCRNLEDHRSLEGTGRETANSRQLPKLPGQKAIPSVDDRETPLFLFTSIMNLELRIINATNLSR